MCLSVILLCYRITCLWFCNKRVCNKKGVLSVPGPVCEPQQEGGVNHCYCSCRSNVLLMMPDKSGPGCQNAGCGGGWPVHPDANIPLLWRGSDELRFSRDAEAAQIPEPFCTKAIPHFHWSVENSSPQPKCNKMGVHFIIQVPKQYCLVLLMS